MYRVSYTSAAIRSGLQPLRAVGAIGGVRRREKGFVRVVELLLPAVLCLCPHVWLYTLRFAHGWMLR